LEAALLAEAQAQGVSAGRFARRVLGQVLTAPAAHPGAPFETGRGMLAQYGPAPSAAVIDANRGRYVPRLRGRLPMIAGVADTHIAIWHLFDDPSEVPDIPIASWRQQRLSRRTGYQP
jgi:hypothetical protein